ncbi:MAG: site-2 protease family protein [Chloroflexota bacterium]
MFDLSLPGLISRLVTLVVALTVHEFAHAWTADQLGDDTPRFSGRLTLNPLAHLDPIGSLMLIIAGFGWAKPVPVNPYALQRRTPAGLMLVSAAGPLANLLLAIIAAVPFRAGLLQAGLVDTALDVWIVRFLQEFILINLILLFFNLIPLAPLDGEKVAEYLLPPRGQEVLHRLRPYGPLILMALILLGGFGSLDLLGLLVHTPAAKVYGLLMS